MQKPLSAIWAPSFLATPPKKTARTSHMLHGRSTYTFTISVSQIVGRYNYYIYIYTRRIWKLVVWFRERHLSEPEVLPIHWKVKQPTVAWTNRTFATGRNTLDMLHWGFSYTTRGFFIASHPAMYISMHSKKRCHELNLNPLNRILATTNKNISVKANARILPSWLVLFWFSHELRKKTSYFPLYLVV